MPVTVTSVRVATVKIGTGKKAKKTTGLVLQFSGDLNPAQAKSLAALPPALRHGQEGPHDVQQERAAVLGPLQCRGEHRHLDPQEQAQPDEAQQLRITASLLTDSYGRPIDGNHDGQPGGDFVATLKGKSVTIASTGTTRASSVSRRALEAIDRVIAGNSLLVTRPVRSFHGQRRSHGVAQESRVVKGFLPVSQEFVSRAAWLRRVFTMTHRLPHNASGSLPHQMVRL